MEARSHGEANPEPESRPEPMSEKKKLVVSQSLLGDVATCGEYAFRRHFSDSKKTTTMGLARGGSVHKGVQFVLERKMRGESTNPEDVGALVARDFTQRLEDASEVLFSPQEREAGTKGIIEETRKSAVRLSLGYVFHFVPLIDPLAVEKHYRFEVRGQDFDLGGTADCLAKHEKGKAIRDTKTCTSKKNDGEVENSVQLGFYALCEEQESGDPADAVALDFLQVMKTGDGVKAYGHEKAAPRDHSATLLRIERAVHLIEKEAWMPADPGGPSGWKCSEKFCEFFQDCPFGRARRVQFGDLK